MKIFPAIDIFEGRAVRLTRGDYAQMTVYHDDPMDAARAFRAAGAEYLHVVDLEGARGGATPNFGAISRVIRESGLAVEVGGGIRDRETVERYVGAGARRVILGTAAVTSPGLVAALTREFGAQIAVGVDIRDGRPAIRGWTETADMQAIDFCRAMEAVGVGTLICTDISKDGLLAGANLELYGELAAELTLDIIASGGVSSLKDVRALARLGIDGAILGKALYTGALDLREALEICKVTAW